jgi:hypothetical protein
MASSIPASTRHHWKDIDLSEIFGLDYSLAINNNISVIKTIASHKKLMRVAKAMYFVCNLYQSIILKNKDLSSKLYKHKKSIVKVIEHISPLVGLHRARKAFGLFPQLYNYWRRSVQCATSAIGICRRIVFNQLTTQEISSINQYLTKSDFLNWPVISVYHQMIRDGVAYMSPSTFYLYARILNLMGLHRRPKALKYSKGIRASLPFEILHMDITQFHTSDCGRVYVSVIVDNYSRFVLGWKMSLHKTASLTLENLKEVYETYSFARFSKIKLLVDGGSENKGEAEQFMNSPGSSIEKLVALSDLSFSNSMAESAHQTVKKYYVPRGGQLSYQQLFDRLTVAFNDICHTRPHHALNGLTPAEALQGIHPDIQSRGLAIKQASRNRIAINKHEECNKCIPQ